MTGAMYHNEGGGLGGASVETRAQAVTLPECAGLPTKQREAWLEVEAYRRVNPDATTKQALDATGISAFNYYEAKKKMEAPPVGGVFGCSKRDLIRPGDKILETAQTYAEAALPPKRKCTRKPKVEILYDSPEVPQPLPDPEPEPQNQEAEELTELDILTHVVTSLSSLLDDAARHRIINSAKLFLGMQVI